MISHQMNRNVTPLDGDISQTDQLILILDQKTSFGSHLFRFHDNNCPETMSAELEHELVAGFFCLYESDLLQIHSDGGDDL